MPSAETGQAQDDITSDDPALYLSHERREWILGLVVPELSYLRFQFKQYLVSEIYDTFVVQHHSH